MVEGLAGGDALERVDLKTPPQQALEAGVVGLRISMEGEGGRESRRGGGAIDDVD